MGKFAECVGKNYVQIAENFQWKVPGKSLRFCIRDGINEAHQKALESAYRKGFQEAQKGFLMHCNQCGIDVVMTTEQKMSKGQAEAIRREIK